MFPFPTHAYTPAHTHTHTHTQVLDMPEALWKAYIDFEISSRQRQRTRILYERLLDRTKHVKVRTCACAQIDIMSRGFQACCVCVGVCMGVFESKWGWSVCVFGCEWVVVYFGGAGL